jgi:hypothetical protein
VRPIDLKWVYKTKRDEARLICKYKGRLVAKGMFVPLVPPSIVASH